MKVNYLVYVADNNNTVLCSVSLPTFTLAQNYVKMLNSRLPANEHADYIRQELLTTENEIDKAIEEAR
jgi:hypothetical protein